MNVYVYIYIQYIHLVISWGEISTTAIPFSGRLSQLHTDLRNWEAKQKLKDRITPQDNFFE